MFRAKRCAWLRHCDEIDDVAYCFCWGRRRYSWCGHQEWPGWVERLLGALMTPFGYECYCRPNPLQFFKWGRAWLERSWRKQLAGGRPRGAWQVSEEYRRWKNGMG